MPNMLSNLVNTGFDNSAYPGQEKMLSMMLSRGSSTPPRAPQAPRIPVPQQDRNRNQGLLDSISAGNRPWQKKIKEQQARDGVSKGLAELVVARKKLGKGFLNGAQRMEILTKYMPLSVATKLNDMIEGEEQKLKPKYTSVTRPNKFGGETTRQETEEYTRNHPIVTKAPELSEEELWIKKHRALLASGETTLDKYSAGQRAILGKEFKKEKSVDKKSDKEPVQTWEKMSSEERSELDIRFNEKFSNEDARKKAGWLNAQDYFIGAGVLYRPEGYASPQEFESQASDLSNFNFDSNINSLAWLSNS